MDLSAKGGRKLEHMGWNQIHQVKRNQNSGKILNIFVMKKCSDGVEHFSDFFSIVK
jgi:hypothetical protein